MRRRSLAVASVVAFAAAASLTAATAASAAEGPFGPSAQSVSPQSAVMPKLEFRGTTSISTVAKPTVATPGAQALVPLVAPKQPAVNKPVPKGDPGPGAPLPLATVNGLPIQSPNLPVMAKVGLTAYDQMAASDYELEPPDSELCAGNGYILQTVNVLLGIYDASGNQLAPPVSGESFFSNFNDLLTDPKCYWDPDTNRFFVTMLLLDGSIFGGGDPTYAGVYIAVSNTSSPLGTWNIYFLDLSDPFGNAGCLLDSGAACIPDQPLLGADKWTLQISTNEFPWFGGFNGAQMFLIDKSALVLGNPFPNVVGYDLADVPTPDGACPTDSSGAPCWYSVQPAESPNGNYDTHLNGTAWAMSALDFVGDNDNRVAVWRFSNTKTISNFIPNIIGDAFLGSITSAPYGMPPDGTQAGGDHPYGEFLGEPVGPIATNDDRMNEVEFNSRTSSLDGALNTGVWVNGPHGPQFRAGILWYRVKIGYSGGVSLPSTVKTGYIAAYRSDVMYPASATTDRGDGIMTFTLTGNTRWPSAAFTRFSNTTSPQKIFVSNPGLGPTDGFTEYGGRPRWGDYSGAQTVGNRIYWTTEYIAQTCTFDEWWFVDFTCGGERAIVTNWANSLNAATLP